MKVEGLLPCTQQPLFLATLRDTISLHDLLYYSSNIHFNIILPSMPKSSKWFFPAGVPSNFYTFYLPNTVISGG